MAFGLNSSSLGYYGLLRFGMIDSVKLVMQQIQERGWTNAENSYPELQRRPVVGPLCNGLAGLKLIMVDDLMPL